MIVINGLCGCFRPRADLLDYTSNRDKNEEIYWLTDLQYW